MPVIVVANPKGGVGKSTVATNLAGALARAGHAVMLGDVDRQQSAAQWLALRPALLPTIRGWDPLHDAVVRPPKGTTHVVLDTPAGLHGKKLDNVIRIADLVLVPLQPSLFDIQATHDFVEPGWPRAKDGQDQYGPFVGDLLKHRSCLFDVQQGLRRDGLGPARQAGIGEQNVIT